MARGAAFAAGLADWLADTPVGTVKPWRSIVFGQQFYLSVFDADHEGGAMAGEAFEFGGGEVEANILSLRVADNDADKGLRADGAFDDAPADADAVGGLGYADFLHGFLRRGFAPFATIADAGDVGSIPGEGAKEARP